MISRARVHAGTRKGAADQERGLAVEAIRADGTSLGLFSTAVAAAAALVEGARNPQEANSLQEPQVRR
jgi:hypothetical protein